MEFVYKFLINGLFHVEMTLNHHRISLQYEYFLLQKDNVINIKNHKKMISDGKMAYFRELIT